MDAAKDRRSAWLLTHDCPPDVTTCELTTPGVGILSARRYSMGTGAEALRHPLTAMMIDHTTTREDLEMVILENDSLYYQLDEKRFLGKGYTTEELRIAVCGWIEAGDECAACA
jgi:hypothetical protein